MPLPLGVSMECAVLFADVAGSTALYERLGDEQAFSLVESCLATVATCTAEVQGLSLIHI